MAGVTAMAASRTLPVLVAGGGLAGLRAALDLAEAGRDVCLVEEGACLGGRLGRLHGLFPTGEAPGPHLAALVAAVTDHPRITLFVRTAVMAITGQAGDFAVTLRSRQPAAITTVAAAAIILATGCAAFDPDSLDTFAHAAIPDVVTSPAFEAMLAAGSLARPSDGASPRTVAWVLCVGSRLRNPVDNGFCSGVCCAASLGQALAVPQCDRTVYAIDLRAHIPGAQAALDQAVADGVAIRYARPHTLTPGPDGRGVGLRSVDEKAREHLESVDLVVLAVGLQVPPAARQLAEAAGIGLSRYGFAKTGCFTPCQTSRDGIFAAGCRRAPGEASLAATDGSAAAAGAALLVPTTHCPGSALVVGGGLAGLQAALTLAKLGADVILVEAANRLGGDVRRRPGTWKGEPVAPAAQALLAAVEQHPRIAVRLGSRLLAVDGEPGRFGAELETPQGCERLSFGAAVLALGGAEARPSQYLYGHDPRVLTLLECEAWVRQRPQEVEAAETIVFIQCAGSREPDWPACARVCCAHALSLAVELKKRRPTLQMVVFYRDVTSYGEHEDLYTEARRLGVLFFRYAPEDKPRVERLGGAIAVTAVDSLLGRTLKFRPDRLILAAPLVPVGVADTAGLFGCAVDGLGFVAPAHPVFFPVDTTWPGVFAAGLCLGPKPLDETMAQAQAAAMRAFAVLIRSAGEETKNC